MRLVARQVKSASASQSAPEIRKADARSGCMWVMVEASALGFGEAWEKMPERRLRDA